MRQLWRQSNNKEQTITEFSITSQLTIEEFTSEAGETSRVKNSGDISDTEQDIRTDRYIHNVIQRYDEYFTSRKASGKIFSNTSCVRTGKVVLENSLPRVVISYTGSPGLKPFSFSRIYPE